MKKRLFLLALLTPYFVFAKPITITFDANDNSGRKEVITYEDSSSVKLPGFSLFEQANNDPTTYNDDTIIDNWSLESDSTTNVYALNYTYDFNNKFPDADSITLYAVWTERYDMSKIYKTTNVIGEGVTYNPTDGYFIPDYSDFTINFHFQEEFIYGDGYQFMQYNKYKLPDYFMNVIPPYLYNVMEEHTPMTVTINRGSEKYYYIGSFYFKDGYLYIDFPKFDTQEAYYFNSSHNVQVNIQCKLKWTKKLIRGKEYYVASLSLGLDDDEKTTEVYPEGDIIVKYVDYDTNEELLEDEKAHDIVGEEFTPEEKEITGYNLVETPEKDLYYFDEGTLTLFYKYKKEQVITNTNKETEIKNPNTGNKEIIVFVIFTTTLLLTFILNKKRKKIST